MTFLMISRMGQFELGDFELAEAPGTPFDAVGTFGEPFAEPGHLATINWLTSEQLGVPRQPYEIELCKKPLDGEDVWRSDGSILLEARANFTFRFTEAIRRLSVDDIFCVTLRCSADDPATEIFAIDGASNEIPETRQSASAVAGTAFLGPNIFGLQASGEVRLEGITAFGVRDTGGREWHPMASVAPALAGVTQYGQQYYLGKAYDAAGALAMRLRADGLARANGGPPESVSLEKLVHREQSGPRADFVLGLEPIATLEQNFAAILADPTWSYTSAKAPHAVELAICPATALQHMSLAGPVEASALGASVTVPIPAPFPYIRSLLQIYEEVATTGRLPIPVVRVTGFHRRANLDVETRQYAMLTFCDTPPRISAHATQARLPQATDLPGTCDVAIVLSRRDRALAFFPDLSDVVDVECFPRDGDRPRAHLAGGDSADETESGMPRIVAGPVNLPPAVPVEQPIQVHGRDIFGRWAPVAQGHCALAPLPVQRPALYAPEFEYPDDGRIYVKFRISWDWSKRTPFDIRIGIATSPDGHQAADPARGINLPSFPAGATLSIRFKGDQPRLEGSELPPGAEVAAILLSDAGAFDHRSYTVRLPMGPVSAQFVDARVGFVAIAADAWETFSGQTPERRSKSAHQQGEYADPRAPTLLGSKWALVWASRPDGANVARAFFDLRSLADGSVQGFHAWRAHENAILDLAAATAFADASARKRFIAGVLGTRDKRVRLAMIQGAVTPHLHKPAFRTAFVDLFEVDRTSLAAEEIELSLGGSQAGLEFVMFSAISPAGVASDRLTLSNLFAMAVPPRLSAEPPFLRLFTPDAGSPLDAFGGLIAVVGAAAAFEPEQLCFYWGDDEASVSDELLHRLTPLSRIDRDEADRLVPGVLGALAGDIYVNRFFFVLQSLPRWGAQHFACAIMRQGGAGLPRDVPTPRSNLVSIRMTPPVGPQLEVAHVEIAEEIVRWTITARNIDAISYESLLPCQFQLDLLDRPNALPKAEPVKLADFMVNGAKAGPVVASAGAPGEIEVRHPVDLAGGHVRLAVSDPAGRFDCLVLKPLSN